MLTLRESLLVLRKGVTPNMNSRFAQIVVILSAFLSMVVLGSCGGNSAAPMVTLTSVVVTSPGQTLAVGSTMQYTATGHFSDGSTSDITASVMWVSSDLTAATIDASGLAKGVTAGKSTTISATKDNVTGSSLLMVVAAAQAPSITSLNPTSGVVGTSVVIAGANFGATQGTSTVKINGVVSIPTVWGASSITAPVPAGATTGNVVVTVGGVASNGVAFTVILPAPSIASLNPTTGVVGTSVVIAGANFGTTQGTSTVKFNGVASTPTVWGALSITAPVPVGATTGNVVVTVAGVASNAKPFTVTLPPPSITSLNPTTGVVGTSVVIAGANFGATQGTSTVKFNGVASTPTVWGASSITAPVPVGATTGSVVVTVSGVASNAKPFTVTLPPPSITSLNPTTGLAGTSVVIAGANFGTTQGTSTVKFNGVASTPTAWGASSITAPVPSGATTGNVVVTVGGVASNGVAFTVTVPPPSISILNPTTGVVGTSVVIAGANFGTTQGTSTVKFNGVASTPTVWGASSITAPVPVGATTGNVVVTVGGVASNGVSFTVTTSAITVTISPKRAGVTLSQPQQFTGTANNDPLNGGVSWSVDGVNGGGAASGTVSGSGLYTPGTQAGVHAVKATSNSNTSVSASATVAVTDLAGVFTYHNDTARTGQNVKEYALTSSTVNSSTFGALFTCQVDGYLYAAPLYYANLNVSGVTHNMAFVATEHDTVYAFDADSPACVQLWKTSFISPPNVVPVAPADVDELSDLTPEIGITSTPVIDPTSNTIYVMAKTKEFVGTVSGVACTSSAPCFVHRLHALSVTDGTEKFGGPVVVTAPNFIPLFHLQRPALLLNNGTVYVAIGSHGDNNTWQGWLMAYNATTLAQQWVYSATDPTSGNNEGAIWGSGNGPAVDASGNIYVETGNGNFDGSKNFSDSVIKVSPAGARLDFFTPFDQQIMQDNDIDLGSSNPIILPDSVGSTAHPHLMIAMGKVGVIYLLDQTNMGGFNAAANQDVEEVTISFNTSSSVLGFYGQPAYWNGNLYEIVVNDSLRQFPISNGNIATSSTSHSTNTFTFRGATPVVSASGTTNGIVWVSDITAYQSSGATILDAYDANNVGTMLFHSPSSGTGSAPIAVKFAVPTVANGKVYVGGQKAFTVFGLLPN
jgi:hypothetical protein